MKQMVQGFSAFAVLIGTSVAFASGGIAPGARIPLDPAKAPIEKIREVINSCLYEETMVSLLPKYTNIQPAPGTTSEPQDLSYKDDTRTGNNDAWTKVTHWYPGQSVDIEFLEQPTNTETRYLSLRLDSTPSYETDGLTAITANLSTDAEGKELSVYLGLEAALPFVETSVEGKQICVTNNWGRQDCTDEEVLKSVDVVIPQDFVSADDWINTDTGAKTYKRFDFQHYTECLTWKFEN